MISDLEGKDNLNRQEYIAKNWQSYPSMPSIASGESLYAGRIQLVEYKPQQSLHLVLVRQGELKNFVIENVPSVAEFLIPGDLVAIKFKSTELPEALKTAEIVLLAPQLRPLPSKQMNHQILSNFGTYLSEIKSFFINNQFLEVKTPSLVLCPGTEPALDVFATELKIGSRKEQLFLPTSPEIHLKKALALGADKIFEIANCYRNGEVTERHQPEFLMLEWYRAFDDLSSIKSDFISLIDQLCKKLGQVGPRSVLSYSVAELFKKYCDFDLTPNTSMEELKQLAEKLDVDVRCAETIDDFFFLIFMEKIESKLPPEDLVFVEKYPPYQAALARLTEDGWGDRFEAYWHGLELCNAFHELNDPKIQRERSAEDLQKKSQAGKEAIQLDEEFFQCLEAGMPPSGGIAVGVERLFMCLYGITQISQLRVFPH